MARDTIFRSTTPLVMICAFVSRAGHANTLIRRQEHAKTFGPAETRFRLVTFHDVFGRRRYTAKFRRGRRRGWGRRGMRWRQRRRVAVAVWKSGAVTGPRSRALIRDTQRDWLEIRFRATFGVFLTGAERYRTLSQRTNDRFCLPRQDPQRFGQRTRAIAQRPPIEDSRPEKSRPVSII